MWRSRVDRVDLLLFWILQGFQHLLLSVSVGEVESSDIARVQVFFDVDIGFKLYISHPQELTLYMILPPN